MENFSLADLVALFGIQDKLETILKNQSELEHYIIRLEKITMSKITDFEAKVEGDFDAVRTGLAALNTQIQALKDQIAAGGTLSAEDSAALDKVAADADTLAASFPPPTPPTPTA